jgi:SNF2 family DNA or RNA helicase
MKTLEPFQKEGVAFLTSRYHAALGDQRGLGKTVQAVHAAAHVHPTKALVVCPASIRTNWQEHIFEHFGSLRGWDILSYNGACDDLRRACLAKSYDLFIGDEIHHCKSTESQRSEAIFGEEGLARRARYKWVLSGTLAPNGRPVELYPLLKTLCKPFAGYSFARYTQEFCGAYFDGVERNVKGASQIEKFTKMMDGFLLRRTARQVYPDRKEPLICPVPVEIAPADMAAVRAAEDEIGGREARLSSSYEKCSQMGDTSKLLHLLGVAMMPTVVPFVEDLLRTENKVVVFAHHRRVIGYLMDNLAGLGFNPAVYVGGMGDISKDIARDRFVNNPSCRVFIGQRQAAGEGINGLQKVASVCVVAEPSWVPKDDEQNVGRLDRMGQDEDLVTAYMMYGKDTLSEIVVKVNARKARIGEKLLNQEGGR